MSIKLGDIFDTIDDIDNLVELSKIQIRHYVEDDVLYGLPAEQEWKLRNPVDVETWNRGYHFTVTSLKKRKGDNNIMMCGIYNGHDDTEFLSYIHGYQSMKRLANAIRETIG